MSECVLFCLAFFVFVRPDRVDVNLCISIATIRCYSTNVSSILLVVVAVVFIINNAL